MTSLTPQEVAKKAAALIRKHGHVKGYSGAPGVGFCILGAIYLAAGRQPYVAFKTEALIKRNIESSVEYLSSWNDSPNRSKEDVLKVLDEVAAEASQQ